MKGDLGCWTELVLGERDVETVDVFGYCDEGLEIKVGTGVAS